MDGHAVFDVAFVKKPTDSSKLELSRLNHDHPLRIAATGHLSVVRLETYPFDGFKCPVWQIYRDGPAFGCG